MGHANIETTMDIYAEVTDTKKAGSNSKFSTQFRCILGKSPAWTDESTTKCVPYDKSTTNSSGVISINMLL